MSMNSKQRWMGGVVLLGGGVLLAALLLKGKDEIYQNEQKAPERSAQVEPKRPTGEGEMVQLQPLTVDVETEKRLLEEQRRGREKAVAEQEARAAEFLVTQQQAEADAARKAAEEYAALNAHRLEAQQSSDNIPPELIEDDAVKQKRLAADKVIAEKKLQQQKVQQQQTDANKKLAENQRQIDAEKKQAELKTAENKAAAQKLAEQKAAESKLAEQKVAERKLAEKKLAEQKVKEETAAKLKADQKQEAEKSWQNRKNCKPSVKQMLRKRPKLKKPVICWKMAISSGWCKWLWQPMKPMLMQWLLSYVLRAIKSPKAPPLKACELWLARLKTERRQMLRVRRSTVMKA